MSASNTTKRGKLYARGGSKYGAKKVKTPAGLVFDSKREYRRWLDLNLLLAAGEISDLKRQIPYEIRVGGVLICKYYADFTYTEDGDFIVEDSKGFRTPEYKLKAKLMLGVFAIAIRET